MKSVIACGRADPRAAARRRTPGGRQGPRVAPRPTGAGSRGSASGLPRPCTPRPQGRRRGERQRRPHAQHTAAPRPPLRPGPVAKVSVHALVCGVADRHVDLLRAYQAQEKRFAERRFPLRFEPENPAIRELYSQSKGLRWNPEDDVPWDRFNPDAYAPDAREAARLTWSRRAWATGNRSYQPPRGTTRTSASEGSRWTRGGVCVTTTGLHRAGSQ